jgi:hypothetical protein
MVEKKFFFAYFYIGIIYFNQSNFNDAYKNYILAGKNGINEGYTLAADLIFNKQIKLDIKKGIEFLNCAKKKSFYAFILLLQHFREVGEFKNFEITAFDLYESFEGINGFIDLCNDKKILERIIQKLISKNDYRLTRFDSKNHFCNKFFENYISLIENIYINIYNN